MTTVHIKREWQDAETARNPPWGIGFYVVRPPWWRRWWYLLTQRPSRAAGLHPEHHPLDWYL